MQNGISYKHSLKVIKKYANGTYLQGYPRVYSLLDAFGAFPQISIDELKALTVEDYTLRAEEFEQHVTLLESVASLNPVNEPMNYNPEYCPISPELAVSMDVIIDIGIQTDDITAYFSIFGKQYDTHALTAMGNPVVVTTESSSASFLFIGWVNAADPETIVSTSAIYEFGITEDTVLIAKYQRTDAIQLVLLSNQYIAQVSGAGNYAPATLVTAVATLADGAVFGGWYDIQSGELVSPLLSYSFNITKYTELEARAYDGSSIYVLSAAKYSDVIIAQGTPSLPPLPGLRISLVSTKSGQMTPCSASVNADWLTASVANYGFFMLVINAGENSTGMARNAVITITQTESGKQISINIQQQAMAPDPDIYEWVLNLSELNAIMNHPRYYQPHILEGSWGPVDPMTVDPGPCTESDYINQPQHMKQTYACIIIYTDMGAMVPEQHSILVTMSIWFDAKIKN
jgi:hypothetical protein